MIGERRAAEMESGGHRALYLDEVRRPVAEGQHEPEAEHDADHRPHRAVETGQRLTRPRVELLVHRRRHLAVGHGVYYLVLQAIPAADLDQPEYGQWNQRRHDHEELQHLVVDRGRKSAERDVAEHHEGRDDQRDPARPAEQRVDHRRQQEQVDTGDEHLGGGEADRVHQVGAGAEAPPHELGNASHLRAVVERHHHHAEEQHGRDGADPVVVHGRQADLGTVGGHPHDLDGAEVRRDERQAGHPRGQPAAGQEEVQACRDLASGDEADAENEDEVDRNKHVVEPAEVEAQHVLCCQCRGGPSHL